MPMAPLWSSAACCLACPTLCSDDVGKATAIEGLQRLEGYVRKHIGKQVRLLLAPVYAAWHALRQPGDSARVACSAG